MSQPQTQPRRGMKTLNAPRPTQVAASVQQAIQRDPLQAMPGEEAAQRRHPVMQAIDLLINYDVNECWEDRDDEQSAYNAAGRELQEYHAEQMRALQQISGNAEEAKRQLAEFIEDVAEMLGFDLTDRTAGEMMEVLRDRLNPPAPLIEPALSDAAEKAGAHLHDVCTVLAKHFGDDPAVTFENAAGLVEHVISDAGDFKEQAAINAREREQLRDQLRECGGVTSPNPQEAEELEAMRETLKALAPLLGLRDDVKDRADLNRIIGKVRSLIENQQPEGWAENAQILVESNKRYENALAAMRNVMSLV